MARPNVDDWLLMDGPFTVFSIVFSYLAFVLFVGPSYMKNRKPYQLKSVLVGYNAFMVAYNLWICARLVNTGAFSHILSCDWCVPLRSTEDLSHVPDDVIYMSWWFSMGKIIELTDTVLFVLRKKDSQVTFLHVFHHSTMALYTWSNLKYIQGEQDIMVGAVNTGVHVIMYFYYMVAALGPKYQKYIWWKKYLTILQLGQFVLLLSYNFALLVFDCDQSKLSSIAFIVTNLTFLALFSAFYRETYTSGVKLN